MARRPRSGRGGRISISLSPLAIHILFPRRAYPLHGFSWYRESGTANTSGIFFLAAAAEPRQPPITRFSWTLSPTNTFRPSGTWMIPFRTTSWGFTGRGTPLSSIVPLLILITDEIALRSEVFPAPLDPIFDMILPLGTRKIHRRGLLCDRNSRIDCVLRAPQSSSPRYAFITSGSLRMNSGFPCARSLPKLRT